MPLLQKIVKIFLCKIVHFGAKFSPVLRCIWSIGGGRPSFFESATGRVVLLLRKGSGRKGEGTRRKRRSKKGEEQDWKKQKGKGRRGPPIEISGYATGSNKKPSCRQNS